MISRDMLLLRQKELLAQRERVALTMHTVDGALQDVEYWLRVLDLPTQELEIVEQSDDANGC